MKTPYKYIPFFSELYRSFKRLIFSILYRGDNVTCPLCNTSFSNWVNNKNFGTCPKCGSAARHRLLYLFLQQNSSFFTATYHILHFAPEKCWQNKFKSMDNIKYITADLSSPEADYKIDITNISFNNERFNIIFCSHVLEHIIDDKKAISELFRVLTPGGTAYIQVPYKSTRITDEDPTIKDPQEREKRFGQFDHVRVYGLDFQDRLESVGFQVTQERYARKLNSTQRKQFGVWDDIIFKCEKKI